MTLNAGLFTSKTDEWETPQDIFDELNHEFNFELDVCALPYNAKCDTYISPTENGLIQPWAKRNWMNPPYGREIGKWVERAYWESLKGNLTVCLLPSRTCTKWFHNFIYKKAEIRFIKGRLKFGDSKNSAPFPSMIVIFRALEGV